MSDGAKKTSARLLSAADQIPLYQHLVILWIPDCVQIGPSFPQQNKNQRSCPDVQYRVAHAGGADDGDLSDLQFVLGLDETDEPVRSIVRRQLVIL